MTDAEGNEIGKLFIGGLSQSTNNGSLRLYFSRFGEVDDAVVMMDNKTGRSRGFGYVKYRDAESVTLALGAKPHVLDGKEVDAKQCNVNMKGRNRRSLKVFVGGIALDQDAESIKNYFRQFGRVTDVNLMMDSNKQRHRGFAFVGFEDESVVKRLINTHYVTMNNKQVEIKAMEPPNFNRKIPSTSCVTAAAVIAGATHGENTCGHLFDNIMDTSTLFPNGLAGLTATVPYGPPHHTYLTAQPSPMPCAQHQTLTQQQTQPSLLTTFGDNHGNLGTGLLSDNLYQPTFIQAPSNQYPTRVSSESAVHSGSKQSVPLLLAGGQFNHPTPLGANGVSEFNTTGPPVYATIPCQIFPSEYVAHPQQSALTGIGQLINVERSTIHGWQAAGVPSAQLTIYPPHLAPQPSIVMCSQLSPTRQSNSPGLQSLNHNNSTSGSLLSPQFTVYPQYATVRLQPEQPTGTQYTTEPQNQGVPAVGAGVVTYGISSTQPGAGDTVLHAGGNPRDASPVLDSKTEVSNSVPNTSSPRIFYPAFMMAALNMPGSAVAASSNPNLNVCQPLWNTSAPSLVYSTFPVGWTAHPNAQPPATQHWESHIPLLPQQHSMTGAHNNDTRLSANIAATVDKPQSTTQVPLSSTTEHTQMASAKASGDSLDGHFTTTEHSNSYSSDNRATKVRTSSKQIYLFDKNKLESKVNNGNRTPHGSSKEMASWTQDTQTCRAGTLNSTETPRWQNPPSCSLSTNGWGEIPQTASAISLNHSILMHHQQPWILSSESISDSLTNCEASASTNPTFVDDSSIQCNSASRGAGFTGSRAMSESVTHQRTLPIKPDSSAKTQQSHCNSLSPNGSRITQRISKYEQPQTVSLQLTTTSPDLPSKTQNENSAHSTSTTFSTKTGDSCKSVALESSHHRGNITRMDYASWVCEHSPGRSHLDSNNGGDSKEIQPGVGLECHGPAGAAGDFHHPVHPGHFADYHLTH